MKQLVIFPTWLLFLVGKRFYKEGHPWYKKKITLTDWADKATMFCINLSMALWVGFILMFACIRALIILGHAII